MKKPLPDLLFEKYLSGECSPEEEAMIEKWYASFDNDAGYTDNLPALEKQLLRDSIRQRISGSIANFETARSRVRRGRIRKIGWMATGIAASAIILIGVLKYKTPAVKSRVKADADITLANLSAGISENLLSDGSHVWLMPGATLAYPKYFSADLRPVNLSGEAFFEVTKNARRPFIIYSKNLITKVWGTSFRVRDAGAAAYADVTVMTGKVSVKKLHPDGGTTAEMMLYPAQQAVYMKKENLLSEKPKANMAAMAIWKKPDISFNNRPLNEVIAVLDKSFQLNITVSDKKINDLLLTADLNGLNFPQIMQILHKALDVDYEIDGQNVVLKNQ